MFHFFITVTGLPNIVLQCYSSLKIKIAKAYWAKIIIAAFCFTKKIIAIIFYYCSTNLLITSISQYRLFMCKNRVSSKFTGSMDIRWPEKTIFARLKSLSTTLVVYKKAFHASRGGRTILRPNFASKFYD